MRDPFLPQPKGSFTTPFEADLARVGFFYALSEPGIIRARDVGSVWRSWRQATWAFKSLCVNHIELLIGIARGRRAAGVAGVADQGGVSDSARAGRAADRAGAGASLNFHRQALNAERQMLIRLRDQGVLGDDVLRRVQEELDLEESRLGD